MKAAVAVRALGQSIWIDNIRRNQLSDGAFRGLVEDEGVTGVTSNPTIFEKAIAAGNDYDAGLRALVGEGTLPAEIFASLALDDLRAAADLLRPIYDRTAGRDGFVSCEVSPGRAHDTEGTIEEARRLWTRLDRPNAMIKIPGTRAGLPAIEQALFEGININITLLFSIARYEDVIEAFLRALERRVDAGLPVDRIASVASFFVSRVDTAVDKEIDTRLAAATDEAERARLQALRGNAAIANAKLAYQRFKASFAGERWTRLEAAGAHIQRPLWASTGTKDPAYSDVYYVDNLIGPHTVNTLPPQTLAAFNEHGVVAPTLEAGVAEARATLRELAALGIELDDVTDRLEGEGVASFVKSFDDLLGSLATKRDAVLKERGGRLTAALGSLRAPVAEAIMELEGMRFTRRLWGKDASLWSKDPHQQPLIRNRLGWLTSADQMLAAVERLESFAANLRAGGITHVVLLGMGGSSLAPEVLAESFERAEQAPELLVLDSTDPAAIKHIEHQIELEHTLFIASSKSGTTTETLSFLEYFWAKREAGTQFAVITDADTPFQRLAQSRDFREIFLNQPDLGGRYSALSFVGLVPAAILGLDLRRLLERARSMAAACGPETRAEDNPAVCLGAILGRAAREGRDKLTLITSPQIASFGFWLEQLIAESTGKQGRGIIPVEGEPLGPVDVYGNDRLFVALQLAGDSDPVRDAALAALEQAGHPVVRLPLTDVYALGGEFFRWEVATATAAALLGVNPFDEPNVQESKDNTKRVLREYELKGALPTEKPVLADGITLYASTPTAAALRRASDLQDALARFLKETGPDDYLAITAYLARTPATESALQAIRLALRDRLKIATTLGYGPRFLHSTGQLHKGGSAKGVFLQITHAPSDALPVPGAPFSFGLLEAAQASGDFQSLQARNRRALGVNLGDDVAAGLKRLADALAQS